MFNQIKNIFSSKTPLSQEAFIKTNLGVIRIRLFGKESPKTVENFLNYVKQGYYNQKIFHRVIDGFMIQGGGYTATFEPEETLPPIQNEAQKDLKNLRGTLAMARTSDPHSATAQFFINLADNDFLDFKSKTPEEYGYAVFGKVTKGMEIVDQIGKTNTQRQTTAVGMMDDVPTIPIVIETIELK